MDTKTFDRKTLTGRHLTRRNLTERFRHKNIRQNTASVLRAKQATERISLEKSHWRISKLYHYIRRTKNISGKKFGMNGKLSGDKPKINCYKSKTQRRFNQRNILGHTKFTHSYQMPRNQKPNLYQTLTIGKILTYQYHMTY